MADFGIKENSARNDVTGVQRKAYAAEIGRLLSKLAENSTFPSEKDSWWKDIIKRSGISQPTLYNWWNAFCTETGVTLTPRHALDHHKQQFYDWLEAQQRHADEEKARKAQEAWAQKREQDLQEQGMPQIDWLSGSGTVLDGTETYVSLPEALALLIQALFDLPFDQWDGRRYLGALRHEAYVRVLEGVALELTPKGLRLLAHHYPRLSRTTLERLHDPGMAFRREGGQ